MVRSKTQLATSTLCSSSLTVTEALTVHIKLKLSQLIEVVSDPIIR